MRPPEHRENQLSLPLCNEVLVLQQAYPRAGRFRMHGLLAQQREEPPRSERTIGRAMAINRQFHGAPGPWQSARADLNVARTTLWSPCEPPTIRLTRDQVPVRAWRSSSL